MYIQACLISSCESSREAVEPSLRSVCGQSAATMCEVGSQGGMDGRWHCSAAQVEILLFQHAHILLLMLFLLLPLSSMFSPCCHRASSSIVSACPVDRLSKERAGLEGEGALGHTSLYYIYKLLLLVNGIQVVFGASPVFS